MMRSRPTVWKNVGSDAHSCKKDANRGYTVYQEAHKAIREDPWKGKDQEKKKSKEEKKAQYKDESLKHKQQKLSKDEKVERVKAKLNNLKSEMET